MRKILFLTILILELSFISANAQTIDTLLNMNGYELHFKIIEGKGMPMLFENGNGDTEAIWDGVAPYIANITKAPLIRYDRQGFGKSTVDSTKKGIENEIIGLENALEKLGYNKKIFLVAHSLGGFYNSLYATRNPKRVKGMVFFDASLPCFFTNEEIINEGNSPKLREIVSTVSKNPLPLSIPLFDIVAEQSAVAHKRWKSCHENLDAMSEKRNGMIADESSHYIFIDNRTLAINAIVTNYAKAQKRKKKNKIIEQGYAYGLTSSNEDYGKLFRYRNSADYLKDWGTTLLQQENSVKKKDAFEILQCNVKIFPDSSIAYEGLGNAWFKTGIIDSAINNYTQSIFKDSTNTNAKHNLQRINSITIVPETVLDSYIGSYNLGEFSVEIEKKKEKLILDLFGTKNIMYFSSDLEFFVYDYDFQFKFTKDENGKIDGFNFAGGKRAIKIK
ncbi:MAG: alpha/beta hydrolase [Prolixibacteraceae bacterium]|jgi:tetratricopeptide (TPR) repeat protein|nr:alpha/beta hydrolase [Prolixibacteraceae bacterium]